MPNQSSTAGKSKTLSSSKQEVADKTEGVLKIKCPCCAKLFRYRRGRVKNPDIKTVENYIKKAQCPFCGQPLKIHAK
jgi:nitrite reductase/ring-hydroxylating ferredoxin subunit